MALSGSLTTALRAGAAANQAQGDLKKLKKACDGMESNFLKQMLSALHNASEEAKPVGDDTGMDTYKGMFDNAVADKLAERGALGISKMTFHATSGRVLNDALKKLK